MQRQWPRRPEPSKPLWRHGDRHRPDCVVRVGVVAARCPLGDLHRVGPRSAVCVLQEIATVLFGAAWAWVGWSPWPVPRRTRIDAWVGVSVSRHCRSIAIAPLVKVEGWFGIVLVGDDNDVGDIIDRYRLRKNRC